MNHSKKKISCFDLYFFGLKLGLKTAFFEHKFNKRIFEAIFIPVHYWRCVEAPAVFNSLSISIHDKVLDLGSPKLLSLYIAKKTGAKVVASDLFDYFLGYCSVFSRQLCLAKKDYVTTIADGRKLNFKSAYFDKAYSLSVLEHIPGKGDTKAIKELARVLKKDGLLSVTVPCGKEFIEEYREKKDFYYGEKYAAVRSKVFYQRIYSEKELFRRIIGPAKLELVRLEFFGERMRFFNGRFSKFLPIWSGPLHPLFSKIMHKNGSDFYEVSSFGMAHMLFRK